ncbi:hypothetical protein Tco_0654531 [Tanacetum coccineum]|uniref:Uncharacterized protein n=1 Tax=Tanacetum coccineum TaxID=301880 RepID=A0ABQ4X3G4_9ASTR
MKTTLRMLISIGKVLVICAGMTVFQSVRDPRHSEGEQGEPLSQGATSETTSNAAFNTIFLQAEENEKKGKLRVAMEDYKAELKIEYLEPGRHRV